MSLSFDEQKSLEDHKALWVVMSGLQKAGFDVIMLVLRTMIFISGGAMVGVLTFLGNLLARDRTSTQRIVAGLSDGIGWFALSLSLSLIAAVCASIVAFVFTATFAKRFFQRVETGYSYFQWPTYAIMILFIVGSVATFIRGMYLAFSALGKF
jgi:hypothetical protein